MFNQKIFIFEKKTKNESVGEKFRRYFLRKKKEKYLKIMVVLYIQMFVIKI